MNNGQDSVDVCVIEDDASQRALLQAQLVQAQCGVVSAGDAEDGLNAIRRHHPRVVICDLQLPGADGIELCRQVRADPTLDGTYIIMLSTCDVREEKHRALNAGADDYLLKPFDREELAARIRNGLRVNRLQERLRRAALTDGLTNLWNHTQLHQLLDREFARTRRYGGVVSLLMLDLDHFKAVNDTFGHEAGNRVLKATSRHLTQTCRDIDIVARYGGEEFVVVCPQTDLHEATRLAERLRLTLTQKVRVPEHPHFPITTSIGVVSSNDARINTVSDMLNLADQALYVGKRSGRNRVTRGDELGGAAAEATVQLDEVDRLRKQIVTLSMQAKELCLQSVWSLVQALEARDPFTASHSRNVTFYTTCLAEAAGWSEPLRGATANAAMLHDLGKIGVPDNILQKPLALLPDEAAILRQVPLITCRILEPLRIFETEIQIIRHLRERFDGSGYPDGLAGANIPIGSRLLAIAEAFDAMTCDRVYRPHRGMHAAAAEIAAEAGRHFDPEFADLLERVVHEQEERWQQRIDSARTQLESAAASVSR